MGRPHRPRWRYRLPTEVGALGPVQGVRRVITAVERTLAGDARLLLEGSSSGRGPGDGYAVDVAARLGHLAGELRAAADGVPLYGVTRRLVGLPPRGNIDAAAADLAMMASNLTGGRAADNRRLRDRVARHLGRTSGSPPGAGDGTGHRP